MFECSNEEIFLLKLLDTVINCKYTGVPTHHRHAQSTDRRINRSLENTTEEKKSEE